MKFLTAEDSKKAEELFRTVELRKELESRESELKTYFKHVAGNEAVLACDGMVMIISDRVRTAVSSDLLIREFGEDFVRKYEIKSHFKQVDIVRNQKITSALKPEEGVK